MTNPSKGSRDPALAVSVAKAVPLLVNYNFPDALITGLGSRFLRYVCHFVNRQKFRCDFP
jgi:hypothetical protein